MAPKRACDVCYRRKIECAIAVQGTPCNWCQHHGLECTFVRERPARKQRNRSKLQSSEVQELKRRVAQLEDALPQPVSEDASSNTASSSPHAPIPGRSTAATTPAADPNTPHAVEDSQPNPPRHVVNSPGPLYAATKDLGPHWFFNGVPIFSDEGERWVSARTGQQVKWSDFRTPLYRPASLAVPHPHEPEPDFQGLIDRSTGYRLLQPFFSTYVPHAIPVIDPVLFEATLETAYEIVDDLLSSPMHIAARACVLAALSIAGRVKVPGCISSSFSPAGFATKAQRLLSLIPGYASLDTLITVVVLQTQCTLSGNWQDAAFYHAVACRTVCALGYHTYLPPNCDAATLSLEQRRSRHGRKLFWLCYTADKDISLHSGVPPLLIDDLCDLTLPQDCLSNNMDTSNLPESSHIDQAACVCTVPRLPSDIRLGQIKERVCRLLYSPQAFKDRDLDSQALLNIRLMGDQIENWRLSVPPPQRPALISFSFSQLLKSRAKHLESMRYVYLQLEYLHLMIIVHMTVRRFKAASTDISSIAEDRHRLIHSSVDISLEASRSMFNCLKVMINALAEEAFWPVVRYATPAAIALVLNMLVHPANEQGQLDLELLISASNLIRCMPTSTLAPSEVASIKDMNSFIMGLVFLGTCAITKAGREVDNDI